MINPRKYLRYPGFKTKAVTLSFDDGQVTDKKMIEILKKYNMKGTFNLISSIVKGNSEKYVLENQLKSVYLDNGMEIAVHGEYHGFWKKQSLLDCISDIVNDRVYLEKATGKIITSMAFPNGRCNSYNAEIDKIVKACGIECARTTWDSSCDLYLPTDWIAFVPIYYRVQDLNKQIEKLLKSNPDKDYMKYPMFFCLSGHSYEFNEFNDWNILEDFCQRVGNKEDTWYATVGEIFAYDKAFNQLVWSAENQFVYNPTNVDIYLNIGANPYIIKAGEFKEVHG